MTIRPARLSDFAHLETFVWQAIFPAFDVDGLTPAQRAENDALVENARTEVIEALDQDGYGVFVAIDPKTRTLAGYVIADARPRAYAEIVRIIVKRAYRGKGVGELLLDEATEFIGRDRAVSLAVRHYNERAIAFFAKHGFENTGETTGDHAIPRSLLLREAHAVSSPPGTNTSTVDNFFDDFPSAADEPVYEELPDYNLATDEEPLFTTGSNALRVEDPIPDEPLETTLDEEQLSVLEAFIAKARARKAAKEQAAGAAFAAPVAKTQPTKSGPTRPEEIRRSSSQPVASAARRTDIESPAQPVSKPAFDRKSIAFEVDYGAASPPPAAAKVADPLAMENSPAKPSFSFDFSLTSQPTTGPQGQQPDDLKTGQAPQLESRSQATSAPYGDQPVKVSEPKRQAATTAGTATMLSDVSGPDPTTVESPVSAPTTKACPDCSTKLPRAARFCFVCGFPQPEEVVVPPAEHDEPEELLELRELPPLDTDDADTPQPIDDASPSATEDGSDQSSARQAAEGAAATPNSRAKATTEPVLIADLRKDFRKHLTDRILAYFGDRKLKKYLARLEEDKAFTQVRDGSLASLTAWLNAGPAADLAHVRRRNTFADLTEYFIVETAGDLSGNILPQRLLRHQSVDWDTADLFKLVMDYLNFDAESEVVHTDFVTMPARALKNATKSFLHAARDERVFFICDQSLISQAKNGFAITDAGIYWKNVLQPAGAATFTTMREPRLEQGHVIIDGQFFDAGGRLNLKVAVLLDKLRRMR